MVGHQSTDKRLLSALLCVCALHFFSSQSVAVEISVEAESASKVHSSSLVHPVTILMCNIQPANASIKSRWITPHGKIISQSSGRYTLTEGLTPFGLGTALAIQSVSYEDAGVYTCEVVPRSSSCNFSNFPASSSVQLVLQVSLGFPDSNMVVSEGATAILRCEMRGYIPPDEALQWYKGDDIIDNGLDQRLSISFEDGTPNAAQNGGSKAVASRVSLLNISSSILSDTGDYSCRVRGSEVSATVALSVEKDIIETMHTPGGAVESTVPLQETHSGPTVVSSSGHPDSNESPPTDRDPFTEQSSETATSPLNGCEAEHSRIVAMTFGITFIVTVLVSAMLTTTVICLWLKLWQHKDKVRAPPTATHKGSGVYKKDKLPQNIQDGDLDEVRDIKYSL